MAEIRPLTLETDPQEAIAEVLLAVGKGEPTADQLAFLNAEADKIEGGLIVHNIDDSGRNEHRIPQGILVRNIDFPDARVPGSKPVVFDIEHTYNYIDRKNRSVTRLDETLAKALLEFSTFNRRLQARIPGGASGSIHTRIASSQLPDSGRVHIDRKSYGKIKAFVEKCPRMSDKYLESKGLSKSEASAVFAELIRDGVVDSHYTEEGYVVLPNRAASPVTAARKRRESLFTRAVNGLFSQLEDEAQPPQIVRTGPYISPSKLRIDRSSLKPITPIDLVVGETEPTVPQREDYLLAEKYWPKVVRHIASQVSPSRHPRDGWPQVIPATALMPLLGKMDKATAEQVIGDVYLKLRKDGVLQPIPSKDMRGRTVFANYQLMKSKEEILTLYDIDEEPPVTDDDEEVGVESSPDGYNYIDLSDLEDIDAKYRERFTNRNLENAAKEIRKTILARVRNGEDYDTVKQETEDAIIFEELGPDAPQDVIDKYLTAELVAAQLIKKHSAAESSRPRSKRRSSR